ncbi:MAG: GlsB/YeaQ/YmgE family stress response membrane protein [Erysipelotrichaceae bacterium]|nr:GlsB/YeaQ/YmgE family stress response membrane protein [Erysipelotrichaceae bacterium]
MIYTIIKLCLSGFAGWFAARLMNIDASNTLMNVALGIVGGMVASFLGSFIGLYGKGLIGGTIFSILGACLVVYVYNNFIKK